MTLIWLGNLAATYKKVKDDKGYSESDLFKSEKSNSNSEPEAVKKVEGINISERQRTVDDDEHIR